MTVDSNSSSSCDSESDDLSIYQSQKLINSEDKNDSKHHKSLPTAASNTGRTEHPRNPSTNAEPESSKDQTNPPQSSNWESIGFKPFGKSQEKLNEIDDNNIEMHDMGGKLCEDSGEKSDCKAPAEASVENETYPGKQVVCVVPNDT